MNTFYVNVVVHGGFEIEAETEDDAISKAEEFDSHKNFDDVFHVDVQSVDHKNYLVCPDCEPGEDE